MSKLKAKSNLATSKTRNLLTYRSRSTILMAKISVQKILVFDLKRPKSSQIRLTIARMSNS